MDRDEIERLIIQAQGMQRWLIVEWVNSDNGVESLERSNFFPVTRVMVGVDYIWGIEFNNGMIRIPIDKIVDMWIK